jgi:hypothetical protein
MPGPLLLVYFMGLLEYCPGPPCRILVITVGCVRLGIYSQQQEQLELLLEFRSCVQYLHGQAERPVNAWSVHHSKYHTCREIFHIANLGMQNAVSAQLSLLVTLYVHKHCWY